MSPALPLRSVAITGRAGRYMSIESGVKDDSSASSASRIGVRVGRLAVGGTAVVVTGENGFTIPQQSRSAAPADQQAVADEAQGAGDAHRRGHRRDGAVEGLADDGAEDRADAELHH